MKISKISAYLLLIMVLAAILRFVAAYYVAIGTDEMIYSVIPLNIISAGRLSTIEQAPVYFYLVDLGYKLTGGLSLVAGRLPSILFGSFAVVVIFLLTQELFENKKISLLAAFFSAVSGYLLRFSQEMDMPAFFFCLLSFFFFIKALKGKLSYLYLSTLFLAIAVMIKPIVLLFVPAYVIIFLWYGYKHQKGIFYKKDAKMHFDTKTLQVLFFCLMLAVLVVSPVLIYNYLLYQENGRTDYYFTVLAGVGDHALYQGQEAEAWTLSHLFMNAKLTLLNLLNFGALLLILGIIGFILAFRKEKYFTSLFLLSILFLFAYIAGKMSGVNHLLWVPLVLSIFAAYAAWKLKEFCMTKFKFKHTIAIIVLISLLISTFALTQIIPQRKTSISIAVEKYARENIPKEAVVIVDPRIYRGILAWSFNQGHYLEGSNFPQLMDMITHSSAPKVNVPLYYIECGTGTNCGWKPDDYQRVYNFSEQLSNVFRTQTQKVADLKAIDHLIIYKGTMTAPLSVYEAVDRTHTFWYTPVGWKYTENAVDNYAPKNFVGKLLNAIGFIILYLDVLIALSSLILIFRLLGKQYD